MPHHICLYTLAARKLKMPSTLPAMAVRVFLIPESAAVLRGLNLLYDTAYVRLFQVDES